MAVIPAIVSYVFTRSIRSGVLRGTPLPNPSSFQTHPKDFHIIDASAKPHHFPHVVKKTTTTLFSNHLSNEQE